MKNIDPKEETIVEECRRIRDQLDEEYAKDPEKYMENMHKKIAKMKAQGVEFITKPLPPLSKKARALVEKHRKEFYGECYTEAESYREESPPCKIKICDSALGIARWVYNHFIALGLRHYKLYAKQEVFYN